MKRGLNFQDIILRLLNYWKEKGCLVRSPTTSRWAPGR
jgi:glycyl-tRNA synthetase alpha subunit